MNSPQITQMGADLGFCSLFDRVLILMRLSTSSLRVSVPLCEIMKKSVCICVICGLFPSSLSALTIASYNLENYLVTDRMIDGRYRKEYPKPEVEKRALRANIIAVNPDILAVQEIGDLPYLEELQRDLARDGLSYPYIYLGEKLHHVTKSIENNTPNISTQDRPRQHR